MKICIVIPTYNEEKTIIKKFENTLSLSYPKENLEIVISDCSNDKTMEIVKKYFKQREDVEVVLYHEDERKGVAYADNKGYSLASGDIIVRTDADVTLDKNALRCALESFKDKKIGCVTGKPVPIGSDPEKNYRDIGTRVQLWESRIDSTIIAHGPFTAFRKKLLKPIDEDSLADDSEISLKIRRQGYKSILNPNIIFYEKTSEKGREEQKIRRASGLIRLLWRNKDIFLNPGYGKYGLIVFPFNFFIMIILPLLLSPLLLILIALKVKGGTILETQQFLLRAMYKLITKEATVYWIPDKEIRK